MKKDTLRKVLVIGLLVLFVGAVLAPSIGSQKYISFGEFKKVNTLEEDPILYTKESYLMDDDWWDNDWLFRKQITIKHSNVEDDLENFPVLVQHTLLDPTNQSQPDGDDFVFTLADGTKLNHEIEKYDSSSGELIAWVNITSLSSVDDTVLYVYYGNDVCGNQENVHGTWDSNFFGVWHLKEGNVRRYDSTSNGRDFNGVSGDPTSIPGKIGKCQDFDGNDCILMYEKNIGQTHTVSFWIKIDGVKEEQEILGRNGEEYICQFLDSTDKLYYVNDGPAIESSAKISSIDTWYYITVIRDGDHGAWYINAENSTSHAGGPTGDTKIFGLGGYEMYGQGSWMIGDADELRISTIIRSLAWIRTSYRNQNDPESFMTFGEQEIVPMKFSLLFGKIENLTTMGEFTRFDAINLRIIQFSPFIFQKVTPGETIITTKLRLCILKEDFAFGLFKVAI